MKVGTDGVLLGAWARGGRHILDVGTGSGLVALMMAQRFEEAEVTAIDIEPGACFQARENVAASPFAGRISVVEAALLSFQGGVYDAIVCNPPFYAGTLKSKTAARTMARSAETLPFTDLFASAARLLSADGVFSVVIPSSCRSVFDAEATVAGVFDAEATVAGLFPLRICALRTLAHKPVSRYLLAYGKRPADMVEEAEHCLNNDDMSRSEWYVGQTKDFYL